MSKDQRWRTDPDAERLMSRIGAQWEVVTVPAKKIDVQRSRHNHARPGMPFDEERSNSIANSMRQGIPIPMPVLLEDGKQFIIMGGNHRVPAAMRAFPNEPIQCYLVRTNDAYIIDSLPRVLNSLHGQAIPHDERAEQIVYMHKAYGLTPKQLASIWTGISADTISTEIRAASVRNKLLSLKFSQDDLRVLTRNTVLAMAPITNTNVLLAVATAIARNKLSVREAQDLVAEVKKKTTEADMLGVVASFGPIDREVRRVTPRTPKQRFGQAVTTMENVTRGIKNITQLQITTQEERQWFGPRAVALGRLLIKLGEQCVDKENQPVRAAHGKGTGQGGRARAAG